MRSRGVSSVAVIAGLAIALAASAQADPMTSGDTAASSRATTTYGNTLSIVFRSGPSGDHFNGRVRASKPACRRRTVVVLRRRSGADKRILAVRTRRGGAWDSSPPGGRVGAGRFYARIRRKVLAGGSRNCAPVETSSVRVQRH